MPFVYFAKRYSATSSATADGEFQCSSCGFTSPVQIVGFGHGTGVAPYFIGKARAAESARQSAAGEARSNMAALQDFVACLRCPKCSKIDPRALKRFWLRGVLLAGAAIIMFAAFGFSLPLMRAGSLKAALWITGIGGGLSVLYIGWVLLGQWFAIKRQIVFLDRSEEVSSEDATSEESSSQADEPTPEEPSPPKKQRRRRRVVSQAE